MLTELVWSITIVSSFNFLPSLRTKAADEATCREGYQAAATATVGRAELRATTQAEAQAASLALQKKI